MEELRSLTPGKGKLPRNSNVTVIHIMPSERANRRVDKEIRRRAEASDLEVITVTPVTKEEASSNLLKLHILNVRTGKIQDAIISSEQDFLRPKVLDKKSGEFEIKILRLLITQFTAAITSRHVGGKNEIIRIKQHSSQPETTFNEININKKFPVKPYKLKTKFVSSKCKCEDNSRMWNCSKIQISIARCRAGQFLCCSGY